MQICDYTPSRCQSKSSPQRSIFSFNVVISLGPDILKGNSLGSGILVVNFSGTRYSNRREIPGFSTCFPASADKKNLRKCVFPFSKLFLSRFKKKGGKLNLRYFSEPKVIQRLLRNVLYHKDFLFPSWQEWLIDVWRKIVIWCLINKYVERFGRDKIYVYAAG